MVNQVAKVGEVCLALGLDGAATKEIRAELINFRKEYARIHGKDLTTASMKDPRSKDTEKLTLAYVEHGLPEYGIPPGKDRWSADGLEARTAPDGTRLIYSKHKETLLRSLEDLMATQNQNHHRYEKYNYSKGGREYRTSSVSPSPDLRRPSQTTQDIISAGDQLPLLRSGRTYGNDASPGNQRVAPVVNMGYSQCLEHGGANSYGGLPHVIDLDSTGDQTTTGLKYSTSSLGDEQHLKSASHNAHQQTESSLNRADASKPESILSSVSDQESNSEEAAMNAEDSEYEDSPTRGSSASDHSHRSGSEGHVPVVRSDQSASKVVVLKCRQLKKRGADKEAAQEGKRLNSPSRHIVEHDADHEQRAKRARIREPVSDLDANVFPNTAKHDSTDTEGHRKRCGAMIAETHMNGEAPEHAIIPSNDGAGNCGLTDMPSTARREPGQADEPGPSSRHSPTFPIWILDPRTPGRSLERWAGSSPLSQSVQYVFDKATELLETNDFEVVRFRFQLVAKDVEWKWRVAKGESEYFETMKEESKIKMNDVLKKSGTDAKALELIIEPLGLAGVEVSRSATAEDTDDKAVYGLDAWYT